MFLRGCTATINQARFFPGTVLAAPDALLAVPPGYVATDQFFDFGELGTVRAVRLDDPDSETAIIDHAGKASFVDAQGTSRTPASLASVTGADVSLFCLITRAAEAPWFQPPSRQP